MLLQNKQVAIIGGGPGGLTLARLLQLKGIRVTVYERDMDEHARVQGSPLDLHENSGLAALEVAGLIEAFQQHFLPGADRKIIVNERAELFLSDHDGKPEEDFGNPSFRPEIDRGALRKILLDSLEPGTVVWNSHFLCMENQNDGWQLHFADGRKAYADLVIAADGANSKIRPYITDIKPFYSGITMIEFNIRNAARKAPGISAFLKGGKVMAFGGEKCILGGHKANGEIGFYTSIKTEEIPQNLIADYSDKSELRAWFQRTYPEWVDFWLELFENMDLPAIPRPIYCMPPNEEWKALPNLTMLGDAAHVMPPFAGEGVNMAMRDALELSESLTSGTYLSLEEAIAHFETEMRSRSAAAALESLENGERMHSENALKEMLQLFERLKA